MAGLGCTSGRPKLMNTAPTKLRCSSMYSSGVNVLALIRRWKPMKLPRQKAVKALPLLFGLTPERKTIYGKRIDDKNFSVMAKKKKKWRRCASDLKPLKQNDIEKIFRMCPGMKRG